MSYQTLGNCVRALRTFGSNPVYASKLLSVQRKPFIDRVWFHTQDTLQLCRAKYDDSINSIEELVNNRIFIHSHFTLLYGLCRLIKPSVTVETGTGAGLTSTYILQALADNGHGKHYSIDLPRTLYDNNDGSLINDEFWVPEEKGSGWMIPENIRGRFTQLLGDSKQVLPKILEESGEIDMFFHDSEHTYEFMTWEFQQAWPYIKKGGYLASHDIDWNNAFKDFSAQVECDPFPMDGWGFMKKL